MSGSYGSASSTGGAIRIANASGSAVFAGACRACRRAALQPSETRVGEIRERLEHANRWRDHVMIVAHRGGGMEATARRAMPETRLPPCASAIALGAEMVELDVQKSKRRRIRRLARFLARPHLDLQGRGSPKRTLAELKACRLVVEGTGAATDERVPTLREMLAVTRDRIFVNIDNKLDVAACRAWSRWRAIWAWPTRSSSSRISGARQKIAEMTRDARAAGGGAIFMPIIADDAVRDARFLEAATQRRLRPMPSS